MGPSSTTLEEIDEVEVTIYQSIGRDILENGKVVSNNILFLSQKYSAVIFDRF